MGERPEVTSDRMYAMLQRVVRAISLTDQAAELLRQPCDDMESIGWSWGDGIAAKIGWERLMVAKARLGNLYESVETSITGALNRAFEDGLGEAARTQPTPRRESITVIDDDGDLEAADDSTSQTSNPIYPGDRVYNNAEKDGGIALLINGESVLYWSDTNPANDSFAVADSGALTICGSKRLSEMQMLSLLARFQPSPPCTPETSGNLDVELAAERATKLAHAHAVLGDYPLDILGEQSPIDDADDVIPHVETALFVGAIVSVGQRIGVVHLLLDNGILVRFGPTRDRSAEWVICDRAKLNVIETCNGIAERDALRRLRDGLWLLNDFMKSNDGVGAEKASA